MKQRWFIGEAPLTSTDCFFITVWTVTDFYPKPLSQLAECHPAQINSYRNDF